MTATRRFARPQSFAAIVAGLIDPTPHPVYRNVVMRSALETDLARHLDNSGVAWRYEPMIFGDYLPDFEIVAVDPPTFIEVKPTLREVPRAKKRMAVIWEVPPDRAARRRLRRGISLVRCDRRWQVDALGRAVGARMSRAEGFDVMDVSTSILHDPKFRRLAREAPAHAGDGFTAYMSAMAESWKAGERLSVEDAWPPILPFDPAVVDALRAVKLIDARGLVTTTAWRGWFDPARKRREQSRERWRRANLKREQEAAVVSTTDRVSRAGKRAATASSPRGSSADTQARPYAPSDSVPSRNHEETPPPPAKRGRRKDETNPRAFGSAPRQTGVNPRANGTSPRQERQAEKRGSTRLAAVLVEAQRRQQASDDEPATEPVPWLAER
ncbi:MAG TPA: hypothetical protein VIM25_12155 [Candidatus Limnocylindrales bacterium]